MGRSLVILLFGLTGSLLPACVGSLEDKPRLGRCSSDTPCKNYGTCQLNTGVCQCPLGFSGDLCQDMLWPACRITLDPLPIDLPPSMRCYVSAGPKNCECIRQCKDQPSADPGQEAVACYERKGVPAEEQLSTFPEEGDRSLAYHGSAFEHFWSRGAMQRDAFLKANNPMFKENERPLSECHNNCSFNGYCGENGWCRCFYGFAGQDCREPVRDACINECSGRGRCLRGYCQCNEGWWGLDCSVELSKTTGWPDLTLFGSPKEAARWAPYSGPYPPEWKAKRARADQGVKIYVYELPSWLNLGSETDMSRVAGQWASLERGIYSAYVFMLEQLLRDVGGARTLNPWEANLFMVPHLPYGVTSNGGPGAELAERAARYVQAVWPFWDRFGGADHIFFAVQDLGECVYHYQWEGGRLPQFLRRAIWMTHWGADHAIFPYRKERTAEEFFPQRCFQEEHYMVVPPGLLKIGETAKETYSQPPLEKDTLFFFAGNIDFNWLAYSLGVRQRLFIGTRHKPGFDMNNEYVNNPNGAHRPYREAVRRSVFCLAPAGGGWGQRLIDALAMGCIPVVVMDDVRQPFDDVLPYNEFALRVSQDDLDDIEEVLRAVPPAEVKRLLANGERYVWRLIWTQPGGLAYNTTIEALQRRLQTIMGEF